MKFRINLFSGGVGGKKGRDLKDKKKVEWVVDSATYDNVIIFRAPH